MSKAKATKKVAPPKIVPINHAELEAWCLKYLKPGIDYDWIHVVKKSTCDKGQKCDNPDHFTKKFLLKPGAEKICIKLNVRPHFPMLEEYERRAIRGEKLDFIILRCELLDIATGMIRAEGIGGRTIEQDYGDLNRTLKMCAKSAQTDAVLRMGGLSGLFTQDLDDQPPRVNGEERITGKQLEILQDLCKKGGWNPDKALPRIAKIHDALTINDLLAINFEAAKKTIQAEIDRKANVKTS